MPLSAPEGFPPAPRIVGRSRAIQNLLRLVRLVAPTDATVLIHGERGTGKELVADALQRWSRRHERPYLKVNCAALPGDLVAGELFGHERGAFTGALQRKAGLLAAAHGGTLFLDEVGDLSLEAQAMLLRFLDQGEVRLLGSTRTFRVDVRLIAATNRDLEAAIARQEFRPDLYDRLSEVVLDVPPLRERREDIPFLVEHFVARYGERHRLRVQGLTRDARRMLQAHSWPGNVRELEKAVSRAVILANGTRIGPEDLGAPLWINGAAPAPRGRGPTPGDQGAASPLTPRQLEVLELAHQRRRVRRADLVTRFGVSERTATRDLTALVQAGLLSRLSRGRGACYRRSGP